MLRSARILIPIIMIVVYASTLVLNTHIVFYYLTLTVTILLNLKILKLLLSKYRPTNHQIEVNRMYAETLHPALLFIIIFH